MTVAKKYREISILETSDVHGNVLPIHYANNQEYQVGLARVATLIGKEREKSEGLIWIDNGDLIQGTPLAYHSARFGRDRMNPMVKMLNQLQVDAAILGNHEFNYGPEVLEQVVQDSEFPWLSANILDKQSGEPIFGTPWMVKDVGDIRVGILGLTTIFIPRWENPAHIEGMKFVDAVETAKRWVKFLKEEQQVDLVVVSYHGGFERDLETGEPIESLTGENQGWQLCAEVPQIDVLLTGHQHRLIAGIGPNGTAVIQPGSQGTHLGKVTVRFEKETDRWQVIAKHPELLSIEESDADQEVLSFVRPYEEAVQEWLDRPIGKIEGDMRVTDPMETRLRANPLIQFFNNVQMEASGAPISNTALFDNHAPGLGSDVTVRDVVANYIYPNTLRVLRLTGQDIKDALERTADYFRQDEYGAPIVNPKFLFPKPVHYNYDMWTGIDYRLDISLPPGQRVVHLTYKGEELAMGGEYEVVMNNYRASGGGGYEMFSDRPIVRDIPTEVSELILDYILKKKVVRAKVDNNWAVLVDGKPV
ncbi:2',3'-cyclic-nucleotide 2'-phosphodiesterase / 3'-nucleotidase [Marininema mesophilum]|uniref:2',3'-cyclic-nucleotide 2'-phosphodiesterase / 3'-nucleotidase n=1 Tax=Marininema mesophilum TaxID=1048340 RepID=A0A1H3CRD3_9BACL|nr:2',3'-cyclic-nucleotide 2'-phosphodiesterase / 3'-nucleotidase [Marininema mesophilum]SDX56814.1 2',3'-cyclic-nucleotide 2'-phosphodiesterase / 3'-nucleotidase [Marininema mesophilum]